MNRIKAVSMFIVLVIIILPKYVMATEAGTWDVNIQGTILASGCDITTQSSSQSIALGDILSGTFSAVGSTSSAKTFMIDLTGCSNNISGASVDFSGTADSVDSTLISLTETGTQATGVGIQLLDQLSTPIPINSSTGVYALNPGSNTLVFQLRYKSTISQVIPGDANAVLYFDMNYQ